MTVESVVSWPAKLGWTKGPKVSLEKIYIKGVLLVNLYIYSWKIFQNFIEGVF